MPNLSITEYVAVGHDILGSPLPAGLEPAFTIQNITFDQSPRKSTNFQPRTKFVRLVSDVDVRLRFERAGETTGVSLSDTLMVAGQTEFFAVETGSAVNVMRAN